MTPVDPIVLTVVMFGMMGTLMIIGMPVALTLGFTGVLTVMWMWGTGGLSMIYYSAFGITYSFTLSAIPPFIFLGVVLEKAGIGKDFYAMCDKILGAIPGGLAIGTIGVCAIMAAIVGQTGPATIMMGLIALPAMLKRGYDKQMIAGAVMAGGALGILIPPSIPMVMYGFLAGQSVGRMFAAGIMPGIMLTIFFMIYILIRCTLQPHMGPPIPLEQRANWKEKMISLKGLVLPGILIFMVLGLIMFGVTSTTEAAAVGAFGSLICAALRRNLTWNVLRESIYSTGRIMGMIMWIVIPAVAFSKIYQGLGAQAMVENFIASVGLGRYGVIAIMMISWYILGCFLEGSAILFLTIPLYVPIILRLGFDPVWFGTLYILNIESAYLTPPYGFNLFYMKAIAPPEITLTDIYWSIIPYVLIQMVTLLIVIMFPEIALWLPDLLFSN